MSKVHLARGERVTAASLAKREAAKRRTGKGPHPIAVVVSRNNGRFDALLFGEDQRRLGLGRTGAWGYRSEAGAVRAVKKQLDDAGVKYGRASVERRGY